MLLSPELLLETMWSRRLTINNDADSRCDEKPLTLYPSIVPSLDCSWALQYRRSLLQKACDGTARASMDRRLRGIDRYHLEIRWSSFGGDCFIAKSHSKKKAPDQICRGEHSEQIEDTVANPSRDSFNVVLVNCVLTEIVARTCSGSEMTTPPWWNNGASSEVSTIRMSCSVLQRASRREFRTKPRAAMQSFGKCLERSSVNRNSLWCPSVSQCRSPIRWRTREDCVASSLASDSK